MNLLEFCQRILTLTAAHIEDAEDILVVLPQEGDELVEDWLADISQIKFKTEDGKRFLEIY